MVYNDGSWNRLFLIYDNYLSLSNSAITIKGSYNSLGGYYINHYNDIENLDNMYEVFFSIDENGFKRYKFFIRTTENTHNIKIFVNDDNLFYPDDDDINPILFGTKFNYDNYLMSPTDIPFDHD
jgi:hypothetical protein